MFHIEFCFLSVRFLIRTYFMTFAQRDHSHMSSPPCNHDWQPSHLAVHGSTTRVHDLRTVYDTVRVHSAAKYRPHTQPWGGFLHGYPCCGRGKFNTTWDHDDCPNNEVHQCGDQYGCHNEQRPRQECTNGCNVTSPGCIVRCNRCHHDITKSPTCTTCSQCHQSTANTPPCIRRCSKCSQITIPTVTATPVAVARQLPLSPSPPPVIATPTRAPAGVIADDNDEELQRILALTRAEHDALQRVAAEAKAKEADQIAMALSLTSNISFIIDSYKCRIINDGWH
jgi:hypothetical protein